MFQLRHMCTHEVHALSIGINYIGRSPGCNKYISFRQKDWLGRICFTPENPDEFVETIKKYKGYK